MTSLNQSDNISENHVVIKEAENTESVIQNKSNKKDTNIAILAETLFLANLLLLPVLPFLMLLYLFRKYTSKQDSIAYNHIRQTFIASILAGIFIVIIAAIFYFFSSTSSAITWTIIITYLTCIHSAFVMLGIFGLSKAMTGQTVKFPLIS